MYLLAEPGQEPRPQSAQPTFGTAAYLLLQIQNYFVCVLQIEFNCRPSHFKVDNWPILLYLPLCHCH